MNGFTPLLDTRDRAMTEARSARPDSPVRPDAPRRDLRLRISAALHRLADRVDPMPTRTPDMAAAGRWRHRRGSRPLDIREISRQDARQQTKTSTGDDRDEYLAGTSKRTAVAAKRDPERQRKSPSSRAPNPAVVKPPAAQ